MQDLDIQALPTTPDANANVQAPPAQDANVGLSADVQQFVVQQPNTDANANVQAQPQGQANQQTPLDSQTAHWQRVANEKQILAFQLQQEIDRIRQENLARQNQPPQMQNVQQNPYNADTDWQSWMKWEQQAAAVSAAKNAAQETLQMVMGYAQQQQQAQAEQQWAMQHPGVDVMQVKAFQKMRGIQNIDDAYTLMSMPMMMNTVQNQAQQQTINQFRQPQVGANAIRSGSNVVDGQPIQLSFEKMAQAYSQNPDIEKTWNPELRQVFWREVSARQGQGR